MANARTRKKLIRVEMAEFHDFDKKAECVGKVLDYREIITKYGAGMVIDLVTEDGERVTVMESAGLKGYSWVELKETGATVAIVNTGFKKGKNGLFREFDVFEL